MVTRIKGLDVYSTEQIVVDANELMTSFDDMLSNVFNLQKQTTSCEAVAVLVDTYYSSESFVAGVKTTLKKLWDQLVAFAKKVWERLVAEYKREREGYFSPQKAKKDAKDTPTPKGSSDIKGELKKIAKAVDAAYAVDESVETDITVKLPYGERKTDIVLKNLSNLIGIYHRRYVVKLSTLFPNLDFLELMELISTAHYSVRDNIRKAIKIYNNAKTDNDVNSIKVELDAASSSTELATFVKTIQRELKLTADNSLPMLEQYKTAVLAINSHLVTVTTETASSSELIDDLFDPNKREIYEIIEQQSKSLAFTTKDKIGSDVSFLAEELDNAGKVDISQFSTESQAVLKDLIGTIMFQLRATEGFVKLIVSCANSEETYIRKFLDLQKLLAIDKG